MLYGVYIIILCGVCAVSNATFTKKNDDIDQDMSLTVPQIIQRHGYPIEVHYVTTPDGYILGLHRIPHGKYNTTRNGKVIFLQHGLVSNSNSWILLGPEKSLGYLLAEEGYDVWMGNVRGTRYSKGHISLKPDSLKFWDFSFHEMAVYDNPTAIDYVLKLTNQTSLYYVGFSMGTTIFFATTSDKPEYNDKIKGMIALGPAVFIDHTISPLMRAFSLLGFGILGKGAIAPNQELTKIFAKIVCGDNFRSEICSSVLFLYCGFDEAQMDMSLVPLIVTHNFGETAVKNIIHYHQLVTSKKFQKYDYGVKKNLEIYGNVNPPEYNLTAVTAPVLLFGSDNDWLVQEPDISRLENLLKNVDRYNVNFHGFNHIDYVFAKDIKPLVNDRIIYFLKYM